MPILVSNFNKNSKISEFLNLLYTEKDSTTQQHANNQSEEDQKPPAVDNHELNETYPDSGSIEFNPPENLEDDNEVPTMDYDNEVVPEANAPAINDVPVQNNVPLFNEMTKKCFTTSQYHETKLLHILNQAHIPHFLYKDILDWARDGKMMVIFLIQKEPTDSARFHILLNGYIWNTSSLKWYL